MDHIERYREIFRDVFSCPANYGKYEGEEERARVSEYRERLMNRYAGAATMDRSR